MSGNKEESEMNAFLDLFPGIEGVEGTSREYAWDTVLASIKEYNEQKKLPVTVSLVHKHFAKDVLYRNEVRQWMERCVNRGLLIRWPPAQAGVTPKRVFYVHIDVYNALLEAKKKPKE